MAGTINFIAVNNRVECLFPKLANGFGFFLTANGQLANCNVSICSF